jgi:hypothetical protein
VCSLVCTYPQKLQGLVLRTHTDVCAQVGVVGDPTIPHVQPRAMLRQESVLQTATQFAQRECRQPCPH